MVLIAGVAAKHVIGEHDGASFTLYGAQADILEISHPVAFFDHAISMAEKRSEDGKPDGISGTWEYAAGIYMEEEIHRLSAAYVAILEEIATEALTASHLELPIV